MKNSGGATFSPQVRARGSHAIVSVVIRAGQLCMLNTRNSVPGRVPIRPQPSSPPPACANALGWTSPWAGQVVLCQPDAEAAF